MGGHTFVLVWMSAGWWRWGRFSTPSPGALFGTVTREQSGSLGIHRRDTPVDVLRARAAEEAGEGVTPECVAVLGRGEASRG
jgi:hypothetical protein